jgi:hypothetical protein
VSNQRDNLDEEARSRYGSDLEKEVRAESNSSVFRGDPYLIAVEHNSSTAHHSRGSASYKHRN